MNLVVDTHAFIWWDSDKAQLSSRALSAFFNPQNQLLLSIVSVWEMQIKAQLGKLTLRLPLQELVDHLTGSAGRLPTRQPRPPGGKLRRAGALVGSRLVRE